MPEVVVSGISSRFRGVSQCEGQIAHVLLTRSPLVYSRRSLTARLACVKHAASVRPEPGSNSPLNSFDHHGASIVFIDFLEYPGKSCSPDDRDRVVLPKGIIDRYRVATRAAPATCRLALQINSSTFGTLLSSQGSSAHLNSASRPRWGTTW